MFIIHTTLVHIILCLVGFTNSEILIFQVDGEVTGENFMYYKLNNGGNLILELNTLQGDADIYVTSRDILPGFYPEYYDLHSATCGKDLVYIPGNFKRPIAVGIFGHPSHDVSNFTLRVHQVPLSSEDRDSAFLLDFNRNEVNVIETRRQLEKNGRDNNGQEASIYNNEGVENDGSSENEGDRSSEIDRAMRNKREERRNQNIRKKMKGFAGKTGLWAFLELFEMIFL